MVITETNIKDFASDWFHTVHKDRKLKLVLYFKTFFYILFNSADLTLDFYSCI